MGLVADFSGAVGWLGLMKENAVWMAVDDQGPVKGFPVSVIIVDGGCQDATGSAAAAFPGQLALSEALADGEHRWVIEQGVEMGRPSRIEVEIEGTPGGVAERVRVGGRSVAAGEGELWLHD